MSSLFFDFDLVYIYLILSSMSSDFYYEYDDTSHNNTKFPWKTSSFENSGLSINLLFNYFRLMKNRVPACRDGMISIHSPDDLPTNFDGTQFSYLYYGSATEVLITPKVIETDENLRSHSPQARQCYFEGERKLKFFKIYTQRNCEFECLSMRLCWWLF